MIAAGGAIALFVTVAAAMARRESGGSPGLQVSERDRIAASILFRVMTSGGALPDRALGEIRRVAGILAPPTAGIDIASWAERYASQSTPEQRARLLENAVQLVATREAAIPLLQYVALLDLSFGLGFHTDALAKLREQYGFDYIDHAKASRPRDADARAERVTFFAREQRDPR